MQYFKTNLRLPSVKGNGIYHKEISLYLGCDLILWLCCNTKKATFCFNHKGHEV